MTDVLDKNWEDLIVRLDERGGASGPRNKIRALLNTISAEVKYDRSYGQVGGDENDAYLLQLLTTAWDTYETDVNASIRDGR